MVQNESQSPARCPQLNERSASAQSLSRGDATASTGPLSKAHKGSSHKLHKAHAVGYGRQPHGRNPSYGKGLNKLSKLGPGGNADGGHVKTHMRSASHSPSSSPISPGVKRNSSTFSLPKHGSSKALAKKTHSHVSLARNGSTTKLGNHTKTEKARMKENLRKKGTNDAPLKNTAHFEVGDEAQDDEWTEDSSSPYTTRQSSANPSRPKTPISRDPPSPDNSTEGQPDGRSPRNLPESPPESPHPGVSEVDLNTARLRTQANGNRKSSYYSHPPDADAVTIRLLDRYGTRTRTSKPQTSNVSASITPPVTSSSPGTTPNTKEPSMPANGISRFLERTGSDSVGGTPSSVTHLQSNLGQVNGKGKGKMKDRGKGKAKADSRRVKSAVDLVTEKLDAFPIESSTPDPTNTSTPGPSDSHPKTEAQDFGPSPWESARGLNPRLGKSLTQLKLDLERRQAEEIDMLPVPSNNPLLNHGYGGLLNLAGLGGNEKEFAARITRQFETAKQELGVVKRFWPEIAQGDLVNEERARRAQMGEREHRQKLAKAANTPVGSPQTSAREANGSINGKSRVRFELGQNSPEEGAKGVPNGSPGGKVAPVLPKPVVDEKLEGLLSRMWVSWELSDTET